jgi:hypothetical protein
LTQKRKEQKKHLKLERKKLFEHSIR